MTTTTVPPVPLPPGAMSTEEWEPNGGGRLYRNFDGEAREVVTGTQYGVHAVVVIAHAVQYADGSIVGGGEPVFEPAIAITTIEDADGVQTDSDVSLTSEAARRLADVLVTAADEIDGWAAK